MTHVIQRPPAEPPSQDGLPDWGENEERPRRPRRKLLTPVTGGLTAVIVAAAGFIGGVQVQKGQATTTTTARGPGGAGFAGFGQGGAGAPPGGAAGGDAASGTVSYVKGDTLYVKNADGTTVKVKVGSSAKVERTASSDAGQVQPGDSVVVQGTTSSGGTVTATAVTATQSGSTG
jgi:hypothetical protein